MEKETIWRVTEEDFRCVIEERYPDLSEEQIEALLDRAHDKFSIIDWEEQVEVFLDIYAKEEK